MEDKALLKRIIEKTIESVAAAIVTTLIVGFFAILWVDRTSIKESFLELNVRTKSAEKTLKAATETLTRELVKFQANDCDRRITELEKGFKEQSDNFERLLAYLNKPGDKGKLPEFNKIKSTIHQPIPASQANQVFKEEQRILDAIKKNDSNDG